MFLFGGLSFNSLSFKRHQIQKLIDIRQHFIPNVQQITVRHRIKGVVQFNQKSTKAEYFSFEIVLVDGIHKLYVFSHNVNATLVLAQQYLNEFVNVGT
jgi:hypothetical protein